MTRSRENLNQAALTYAALATATMGNASPAVVVPANADRRELIITNVSDSTGYIAIGSGTGLTTSVYAMSISAGETIVFSDFISTQAIYAVCGAASKNVAYQEAT